MNKKKIEFEIPITVKDSGIQNLGATVYTQDVKSIQIVVKFVDGCKCPISINDYRPEIVFKTKYKTTKAEIMTVSENKAVYNLDVDSICKSDVAVLGSIYLYKDEQVIDTGIFSFMIKQSLVDQISHEQEEYYVGKLEELLEEIKQEKGIGSIDLSGYATESYVNEKFDNIDFSPYVTEDELPNLDDYATKSDVDTEIKEQLKNFELTDEQREKLRGQDGKSIAIRETRTDENGNIVVEFTDDTVVTIPKGMKGDKGEDGKSSKTTVTPGTNEQGDKGQWISTYFDKNGDGEFTEDELVSKEFIKDGKDGQPGKDGESITITNTTTDEQGNTLITFSDETSVTIQRGLSAFEVWEKQPNNKGKSVDDFFDFIKGDGVDDDSIWKTALQKDDVFSKDEIDFTNLYSYNATEIFHKKILIQDYGDSGRKKSVVDVIFYRNEYSSFDLSSIEYISIKNLFIKIPSDYIEWTSLSVYTFTLDEVNEVFGTYLKLLPNDAIRIDFPIDVEIVAWFRKEV